MGARKKTYPYSTLDVRRDGTLTEAVVAAHRHLKTLGHVPLNQGVAFECPTCGLSASVQEREGAKVARWYLCGEAAVTGCRQVAAPPATPDATTAKADAIAAEIAATARLLAEMVIAADPGCEYGLLIMSFVVPQTETAVSIGVQIAADKAKRAGATNGQGI